MNDKLQQVLITLAEKLGVTVEHLWAVLVRQASISAAADVLLAALLVAAAVWLTKLVRRKTTAPAATPEDRWPPCAELSDEVGVAFAWVGVAVSWAVAAIVFVCAAKQAATAIFNPEFFAMEQVLRLL